MGFSRYVEAGRVCLVNYGPSKGSLVAVVDVVDGNKVICESPTFKREVLSLKRLSLTDIKMDKFVRGMRTKNLIKQWNVSFSVGASSSL